MTHTPDPPPQASYRSAAIRGASWITGARILRSVSAVVTLSILSRLLTPEDFGIAGLIIFITGLAQTIGDFGTRVALIRKPEVTEIELHSAFWCNTLIGLTLSTAVLVLSPQIATLLGSPTMADPLRWASPLFLLVSLQSISSVLLERKLAFGTLAIVEVVSTLAGAVAAIGLALIGWRIGALLAQMLAIAIVGTGMLLVAARWMPRLQFSLAALTPLINIGMWTSFTALVAYAGANLERPILAGAISAAALGYFTLAQQIIANPLRTIVQVVRKLTLPIFSRLQEDTARARNAYLDTVHAMVLALAGICFGIAAVADPLVQVLFGPGWEPVAPLLVLLAFRAVLNSVNDFNAGILTAKGLVRFQFWWSLGSTIVSLGVMLWSTQWGLIIVVVARLVLLMVTSPIYAHVTFRAMSVPWPAFLGIVARPVLAGAAMGGLVYLMCQSLPLGNLALLLVATPVGAVLYVALLLVVDRARFMKLVGSLSKRGG